MKLKIEIEAIRWDGSTETYEKLRFLALPRGILRDPVNRDILLYGAVDIKEVLLGNWVIRFPDGNCHVYRDHDARRLSERL